MHNDLHLKKCIYLIIYRKFFGSSSFYENERSKNPGEYVCRQFGILRPLYDDYAVSHVRA